MIVKNKQQIAIFNMSTKLYSYTISIFCLTLRAKVNNIFKINKKISKIHIVNFENKKSMPNVKHLFSIYYTELRVFRQCGCLKAKSTGKTFCLPVLLLFIK